MLNRKFRLVLECTTLVVETFRLVLDLVNMAINYPRDQSRPSAA